MNRLVRCPECSTVYAVVPDQLKIANGLLRCGQCQHAFDSTGLVVAWPESFMFEREATETVDQTERVVIDELLKQEDKSEAEIQSVTSVSAFEEALATFKPEPLTPVLNEAMPVESGVTDHHHPETLPPEQGACTTVGPHSSLPKLGVLVLLLALALQWLWIERHTLAAAEPGAARVWQTLCQTRGCEISLQQVRDGIVIENSRLTPREEGGFLLSWSLRNTTSQALQTPALELTLLSAQDKTLVRRVFSVADLGAPVSLAAGQTGDGQLHVLLEDGLMPSGYRLLSFYP